MRFSPIHQDNIIRAIYGTLVLSSFVLMSLGTGIVHTIFMCISVVFLCTGLFLFTKTDLTTYTYIVMENDSRLDFYVDKKTGRRGAYVCYYPLCDTVAFEKCHRGIKKEIRQKHGKVFFYNYCHNRFCGEKYMLVFENEGYCDAIICELDQKSCNYLKNCISKEADKGSED